MSKSFTSLPRSKPKKKTRKVFIEKSFVKHKEWKQEPYVLCRVLPRLVADCPEFIDLPIVVYRVSLYKIAELLKQKYKIINDLIKNR